MDLVPGRSGTAHENWLAERGEQFRSGIQIATLNPFQGYKNAIDDQLQDTTSVLDAFHIVILAGDAPGEVRRRVQQDTTGHRGRTGNPLSPGPQSFARLTHASSPHANKNASVRPSWQMRHTSVSKSPTFTGQVRDVFHQDTPAQGQRLAAHLIQRLPACPIPEIARLGRTLRKWKDALDAYFDTGGASNGPTEAINGHYRAGQTHRQKLPQPHQPPTPNAPHRRRPRRLHPHSTLKSPLWRSVLSDYRCARVPVLPFVGLNAPFGARCFLTTDVATS